jgi:hypothetical protein
MANVLRQQPSFRLRSENLIPTTNKGKNNKVAINSFFEITPTAYTKAIMKVWTGSAWLTVTDS